MKIRLVMAGWGLCFVVALAGCGKKPGGKCENEGEAECKGHDVALTCHSGTWMEVHCRGPKACNQSGAVVSCDESLAQIGDACNQEKNMACAADKKSTLTCAGGKWVAGDACPKGCEVKGTMVHCEE